MQCQGKDSNLQYYALSGRVYQFRHPEQTTTPYGGQSFPHSHATTAFTHSLRPLTGVSRQVPERSPLLAVTTLQVSALELPVSSRESLRLLGG
jgi:hypothetical protein